MKIQKQVSFEPHPAHTQAHVLTSFLRVLQRWRPGPKLPALVEGFSQTEFF